MSDNSNNDPQKYIGIIFFVFLVMAVYAGYTIFNYYSSSATLQGFSYLSEDLNKMEYLFEMKNQTKEECLQNCKTDYLCSGLTYDASSNTCYGVKNGKLRSDDSHIYAWAKDRSSAEIASDDNLMVSWTKTSQIIPRQQIMVPPFPNRFSVSFWIQIDNWYHNHALWRSILYQGTPPDDELNLTTWGDVITKMPKQRFGVWLAPYTNNIRCVIGTKVPFDTGIATEHPTNKLCKGKNCYVKVDKSNDKYYYELEHVDLKNIDINIPFMVTMVVEDHSLGIYFNGKLRHNIKLDGMPVPLNSDCYVKPEKSYDGHIMEVRIWPKELTNGFIKTQYDTQLKSMQKLLADKK
jgi:hypothetical protein